MRDEWAQVKEEDLLRAEGRHAPCSCGPISETAKGFYSRGCIVHDEVAFRRSVLEELAALKKKKTIAAL